MGSITLADVGMTFLGSDPTSGNAPACQFPHVMVCFPGLSQCDTVGCTGSAGAGTVSFPPSLNPHPAQGTARNRFLPCPVGMGGANHIAGGGGAMNIPGSGWAPLGLWDSLWTGGRHVLVFGAVEWTPKG